MKRLCAILVGTVLCVGISGCEQDPCSTETVTETVRESITLVWAMHWSGFASPPGHSTPDRQAETWVDGMVLADPIPSFHSVTVNDQVFAGPAYAAYGPYLTFGSSAEPITIYSDFDPVAVTVQTSAGAVSGVVGLPGPVTDLYLSEYEHLELGEPLTVSWSGGDDADFFYFYLDYTHADVDTVLTSNSVTIDGSVFAHDGYIWGVSVMPMGGPLPRPGTAGNMTGDGTGYLYHGRLGYYVSVDIQVGDGYERGKDRQPVRSQEEAAIRARASVERALGLPCGEHR